MTVLRWRHNPSLTVSDYALSVMVERLGQLDQRPVAVHCPSLRDEAMPKLARFTHWEWAYRGWPVRFGFGVTIRPYHRYSYYYDISLLHYTCKLISLDTLILDIGDGPESHQIVDGCITRNGEQHRVQYHFHNHQVLHRGFVWLSDLTTSEMINVTPASR
jgi:hypothetical protein